MSRCRHWVSIYIIVRMLSRSPPNLTVWLVRDETAPHRQPQRFITCLCRLSNLIAWTRRNVVIRCYKCSAGDSRGISLWDYSGGTLRLIEFRTSMKISLGEHSPQRAPILRASRLLADLFVWCLVPRPSHTPVCKRPLCTSVLWPTLTAEESASSVVCTHCSMVTKSRSV